MNKKSRTGVRIGALLLAQAVFLGGCGKENTGSNVSNGTLFAMDTYMTFQVYGGSDKQIKQAEEEISRIEEIFSVTKQDSEVAKVNRDAGEQQEISKELYDVAEQSLAISKKSGGAFDISIYPVLKSWGFTTGEYRVVEQEEVESLLTHTGYENIALKKEGERYYIRLDSGMEIDFGGIAKGYAAEKAVEVLKKGGVESAILNLGGNVQTIGKKPDGSMWNVAVKDPKKPDGYVGILKIGERAVITSGGYERYFVDEDGRTWSHIIDPATGYPAKSGLSSVTVIGEKGMVCDALSTAFYVMGLERAEEYWKNYGDIEILFITEEGDIYITEGLEKSFEPAGEYADKKVHVIKSPLPD